MIAQLTRSTQGHGEQCNIHMPWSSSHLTSWGCLFAWLWLCGRFSHVFWYVIGWIYWPMMSYDVYYDHLSLWSWQWIWYTLRIWHRHQDYACGFVICFFTRICWAWYDHSNHDFQSARLWCFRTPHMPCCCASCNSVKKKTHLKISLDISMSFKVFHDMYDLLHIMMIC